MLKKKAKIIIPIVLGIIIMFFSISYAGNSTSFTAEDIFKGAREFIQRGEKGTDEIKPDEIGKNFATSFKPVISTALAVGIAISVGALIIAGTKMAMSSAKGESLAKSKERLTAVVIGIIIFGLSIPIFTFAVGILSDIEGSI